MKASVVEISQRLAKQTPDRTIFTFVNDAGQVASTLTCKQVYERALQIADSLVSRESLKKGDRVLLVYPQGLEFVEAFLGCLLAGLVPVPVPAPMPLRPEIGLLGYTAIAIDCGARAQLTCQSYSRTRSFGRILSALKNGLKRPDLAWPDLPWIVTDTIRSDTLFDPILPSPSELAFLQYTSGSTRSPRGVCLSYGNISSQIHLLEKELQLGKPESTAVFWMPHYHDFALIGGVINALCGIHHYVSFSASGFLRRPALWGELIHRHHATHMGAPDFGYRLFTLNTTSDQRQSWDFSSMVAAICAAEPIKAKTVDEFLTAFEVSGLKPAAFCPSYGLAEHTVAVTLHGRGRFRVQGEDRLGCGSPGEGVQIKIVDLDTGVAVAEGSIGEIWVDSPSKSNGYFNSDEESQEKFHARLQDSAETWLRTGDFGTLIDGQLVILSRIDDMIIFRGHNVFPQDAEKTVADADARVRPGRVIAFGVQEEESKLVVVFELKDQKQSDEEMNEILSCIRSLLLQELGVPQTILVVVPKGTIPKTSSGKLQRKKCKSDWLAEKLPILKVDRALN